MKSIKRVLFALVYSNLIIALSAAAMAYVTYIIFGIDPDLKVMGFLFCITLFTYNFQRIVRFSPNNLEKQSLRNSWIIESKKGLGFLVIISGIASVVFLPFLKLRSLWVLLPLGFIAIFYAIKVFPFKGEKIALREIRFSKIFLITITWVGATVWFPLLQSELYGSISEEVIIATLQRFIFIFAITIPFDIRDMKYDRPEQGTFPQIFGIKRSIKIATILLFIFCFLSYYQFANVFIEEGSFFALLISGFSTIYFVSKTKFNSPEMFYTGLLDGTMIIQGILIYLFFNFV